MYEEKIVLCVSNSYEKKYYLNDNFESLPKQVKDELKILCVLYTEEIGGILSLEFEEDGTLQFVVQADENDLLFDEIGSVLKMKQIREEKKELLEALETYYKVFFLQ
ncbi:MAG: DUF6145 family protein [Lachnospiraceae bacterium]|nr:DUF6145 family protein [Lachnospiraceae bacterium]